jgi:hypothetical protein
MTTRDSKRRLYENDRIEAFRIIDKIGTLDGSKIDVSQVKDALGYLDKTFKEGPLQKGYLFDVISHTWSLLNVLRIKQHAEGQAAVRKQLEIWKSDFPDEDIKRWVDQAIERVGPAPQRLHVEVEMLPDGTFRAYDPSQHEKGAPK